MSQPEENREKTGKTDSTMNRRQAPSGQAADRAEAVDNAAVLNEARERTGRGRRSR